MNEKVLDLPGIGMRIRTAREKLGLTREQFAEAVDLSALYIGQIERGQRTMSLNTFVRILECLHVDPNDIIFGEQEEQKVDTSVVQALLEKCNEREMKLAEEMLKLILTYVK